MIPVDYYYILATFVFFCGLTGILLRRNLIIVLMSIELMLNATNIIFVAASQANANLDGEIMVLFIITVAACEAAVGLAMVVALYRKLGSVDTNLLRTLRG